MAIVTPMFPTRDEWPECAYMYCDRGVTHLEAPYCSKRCQIADVDVEDIGSWGKWAATNNHAVGVISLNYDGEHITDFDIDNTKQMDAWKTLRALITGASKP